MSQWTLREGFEANRLQAIRRPARTDMSESECRECGRILNETVGSLAMVSGSIGFIICVAKEFEYVIFRSYSYKCLDFVRQALLRVSSV
jgi:hypothetical protein